MTKMIKFGAVALLVALSGCISTTQQAQMEGIATGNTDLRYPTQLKGRMTGSGSAFMLSPGFAALSGGDTSAQKAYQSAVGNALWDKDDVDALIGTKSKIETTSFLGIFEVSRAQIKGIGVGVQLGQSY